MSSLTDIVARVKSLDADLGENLAKEIKSYTSRRQFGLNFERHQPEFVDLPGRDIRLGDKVRLRNDSMSAKAKDQRIWKVNGFSENRKQVQMESLYESSPERKVVRVGDVVVSSHFQDNVYPGLVSTGTVKRGGDKPFHTVINGENFHVLEALTFSHPYKIDVIYIDPPYNSGSQDWKYNNNYVEKEDLYRHSKWLAFMERRLLLASKLLNPECSVLIVTIDEKEYLRLGLLLEQTFPGCNIQMISSVINPKGTGRSGKEFQRTNEFIYTVLIGEMRIAALDTPKKGSYPKLAWQTFRRTDKPSQRGGRGKNQFYPIYVNRKTGRIDSVGEPLPFDASIDSAPAVDGCEAVFPIRPQRDGIKEREMSWGAVAEECRKRIGKGYLRAGSATPNEPQKYIIQYLKDADIAGIENGSVKCVRNVDGSLDGSWTKPKTIMPTTQWERKSHNAEHYGSVVIRNLLDDRDFQFPKSLHAVEDILRYFVSTRKDAVILDFFAGSGTTAHAVMRLNKSDDGRRQCISVTNNEVSAEEEVKLRKQGFNPGDDEWESLGVSEYITKPRIRAAITGKTPSNQPVPGHYKFDFHVELKDPVPMKDGFEENAEFFTLTYEDCDAVEYNMAFRKVAPLLWMMAGGKGERIDKIPKSGWAVVERYGVIKDMGKASAFCAEIAKSGALAFAFVITDNASLFQSVARNISSDVKIVRLYESYLSNFRLSMGLAS